MGIITKNIASYFMPPRQPARNSPGPRIRPGPATKRVRDWWISGIIFFAMMLRVYRLDSLTEFLGDQGRTMLILYDWVHRGVLPLAGPTTLSGQHLGPFFYYLILPGYLLSGGPVGVSLWMALLGVFATYLLYRAVNMIYGRIPALAASALYAVAPALVQQDRIIWEPNLVPLFAIIFAWLLLQQHPRVSFRRVIAQGAVCGILVQLHYPNIFFIALVAVVSLGHSIRLKQWRYIPIATAGWLIGFLAAMAPFTVYEYTHGFADVRGVAQVFVSAGAGMGKRETLLHALDYAGRVFGKMLPGITGPVVLVLLAGWCVFLVGHFTSWNIFWTVWFFLGVFSIARYNGVVYDHYLNFLIPVPFFMVGSVVSSIRSRMLQVAALTIVCVIVGLQIGRTDIFSAGASDIKRVSLTVSRMIGEAGGKPFSFTLMRSRSFSDLHYRYYFRVMGREPESITAAHYPVLFLVCDQASCPSPGEITGRSEVPVLCYDAHCNEFYPTIPLAKDWSFDHEEPIQTEGKMLGTLYEFHRK